MTHFPRPGLVLRDESFYPPAMSSQRNDFQRILRALRVAPTDPVADRVAGLWQKALRLAQPTTFAKDLEREDFLDRFAPHARASLRLMHRLRGCDRVWVLAATLGPDLENHAAKLFADSRAFDGYALERMGAFLADKTMRQLKAELGALAPCGPSYSPGYLDFSLEAQAPLVALARQGLPLLGLTAGYALTPSMSVTAVMGRFAP